MTEGQSKVSVDLNFIDLTNRAASGSAVLSSESDRGCALVAAAMLDETMASVLRSFFVDDENVVDDLLGPGRPLTTFSSRISLCRAIGLITPEMYGDLTIIRKIRNIAAHFDRDNPSGHKFTFSDPPVADRCRALVTCPREMREKLPARLTFESFVSMVSAIFAEYAINCRIAKDHKAHEVGRQMLLELLPSVKFTGHLEKLRAGIRPKLIP